MQKRFVLAILAGLAMTGCVTADEEPAAPGEAVADDKVLFDCKPEAGSPHQTIHVLVPTQEEIDAETAADAAAHEDDDGPSDPVADAAENTDDQPVIIAVSKGTRGTNGHCYHRAQAFACATGDDSLRLAWAAPEGGEAAVNVQEKWLFGTKKYQATCVRKG